ncbi:MAG: arginine N-succinyltransferase [Amphiplicatus sp.]
MSLPFLRPVREDDLDAVAALAGRAGGGMTNLPADRKALKARLDLSVASFAKAATAPGGEVYMLVLEAEGAVIGVTGIFSAIGLDSCFINYKINHEFSFSRALGKRAMRRVLVPSHDFTGAAEVGMLFMAPEARGGGLGKLMARARYMFIAQSSAVIAGHVCAELRGWRAPDGAQPFWNAVGRRFFEMDFEAADAANAANGNQFIQDMMPRYPIYVDLMAEDARACIGRPHESAEPALKMLKEEGFAFNNYIDVFDGGPLLDARVADLKTVRESRVLKLAEIADVGAAPPALLAAGGLASFRAVKAPARIEGERVVIDRQTAAALKAERGAALRWRAW